MNQFEVFTAEQEIEMVKNDLGSHIVILGAGASLAAFPTGDRNGKKLPLMNNLVGIVGLEPIFQKYSIKESGQNFEEIYSQIYQQNSSHPALKEIEETIYTYFSEMQLPDDPTIYDKLLLSLRPKDIVATFNWDPFLYQAYERNCRYDLPNIYFLHGNVAIGYCFCKKHFLGPPGELCGYCCGPLKQTNLLFPILDKNYKDDEFIKSQWDRLQTSLNKASFITIFGYGAPSTDKKAVDLMHFPWKENRSYEINQTEIIDIRCEREIRNLWKNFICSHHYDIRKDFYSSWIARHPRRSCEALYNQTMMCKFISDNPLPKNCSFEDLRQWFQPLFDAEIDGYR